MTRKAILTLALLAFSGIAAFGGPVLTIGDAGLPAGSGVPFSGSLSPAQPGLTNPFTVWCVDYLNFALDGQEVNISTPTDLASISNTRYGGVDGVNYPWQITNGGLTNSPLLRYLVAAYLITTIDIVNGNQNPNNALIQQAIWGVLAVTGQAASPGFPGNAASLTPFIQGAVNFVNANPGFGNNVRILTDVAVAGTSYPERFEAGAQEFITIVSSPVPEPGTYGLLSLGLVGLGLARRKLK